MGRRKRNSGIEVIESCGNVARDLGLPNPEERETKVRIAFALNTILDRLGWTQQNIAARLGTDQPKVSALRNYKLAGLSLARLMEFLTALDYDVDINIRPKKRSRTARAARIQVKVNAA